MNNKGSHLANKGINRQSGFTIVEVLVAGALLAGVLIPSLLFFGRVTARRENRDRITAMSIAVSEMERMTASEDYHDNETIIYQAGREWKVTESTDDWLGLIELEVRVSYSKREKSLAVLKTMRLDSDQHAKND